ncbi:hypothetical protein E1176_02610 [Fulvivirga sp. RKSG066]|uniref:hypothetical protein n=1 Tax=Fulvivirga aurantia TaxID=2529383 RepID=UPI0012BD0B74|nr:hypothetical protein [Fulvivirga aurantia]MTI19903.1 hypothetical protein [Fulvivirga aurantia]
MERNNLILLVSSVLLFVIGQTLFPLAIFLSLAPLFALLQIEHPLKFKHADVLVLIALVVSFGIWALLSQLNLWLALSFSVLVWLSTVIYTFTNRYSKNKIGLLTLVIYWLALEYVAISLNPEFAHVLLGNALEVTPFIPWSASSGLTGVSCWILIGNILLYLSLFKDGGILEGRFRWLTLSYCIIGIALPIIISYFITFDVPPITSELVQKSYSGYLIEVGHYDRTGEVFGRTSAWVAVLIILYAFVKKEVK